MAFELVQDYAPSTFLGAKVKEKSYYARFYQDFASGQSMMVAQGLPMCQPTGRSLANLWRDASSQFSVSDNLFDVSFKANEITLGCPQDQPDGRKAGDSVTFQPELYIAGSKVNPETTLPKIMDVDPFNPNYGNNCLVHDYGAVKRIARVIEGRYQGFWLIPVNLGKEVRIKYNQTGQFRLRLSPDWTINTDEEVFPASIGRFLTQKDVFQYSGADYYLLYDSATFYPDANPESTSVDGMVRKMDNDYTWSDIRTAVTGVAYPSNINTYTPYFRPGENTGNYYALARTYTLFDTSSLPDSAVIASATISIYGYTKNDNNYMAPNLNVYSSNPDSNTDLVASDYGIAKFGASAYCDTPLSYSSFNVSGYNDFALNATGKAAIDKAGISKFGWMNAQFDRSGTEPGIPGNPSAPESGCYWYMADQGAGYKPKLAVTYSTPQSYTRSISAGMRISTSLSRVRGSSRSISAGMGISPSLIKAYAGNRTLPVSIGMAANLTRQGTFSRVLYPTSWKTGWLQDFKYRYPFTIDHTKIDADLTHFPVLLKLSEDQSDIFTELGSSYLKIAVTTDDGLTQLYVEVVEWDAVNNFAELWVSKSSWTISNMADTILYFYYDKNHTDNSSYVGLAGSAPGKVVWDANFVGVWHMNDNPDSSHIKDSTTYANNGTKKGIGEPAEGTGIIGKMQLFDGTDDYILVSNAASLQITGALTMETACRMSGAATKTLFGKGDWFSGGGYFLRHDSGKLDVFVRNAGGYDGIGVASLTSTAWHYIAGVFEPSTSIKCQIDDAVTTKATTLDSIAVEASTLRMGAYAAGSWLLTGREDENRLSNIARSDAWLKATYYTCWDELATWGDIEEHPSALIGMTSSLSRSTGFVRSILAAINMVSAMSRVAKYGRSLPASSGLSAAISRACHYGRTVTTSIGLSATVSRALAIFRNISSNIGLDTAISRAATFNRVLLSSVGLTAAISRLQVHIRSLAAAIGVKVFPLAWRGRFHRVMSQTGINRTDSQAGTNRTISHTGTNRDMENY